MARKKQKWAAADCETDSFDGEAVSAFIWGYKDSDGDAEIFWSTEEFLNWLENFDGKVYAHNGGKFDWLEPEIIDRFNDGKIMLINGRLAKAKIGKAEIRDSFLCLPAPLAKFGEKDDFDYSILVREKKSTRKKYKSVIEKYLRQDCVALYNAMERYIEKYGHSLTQAGAALKTWESMGGEKRRYGKAHHEKFVKYYFGGRCEVFEYADNLVGNFKMYDINSSYPFAMTHDHCVGTDYIRTKNIETVQDNPSSFWTLECVSHGAFCVREGKKVFFPRDAEKRLFHITGWELREALKLGIISDAEIIEGLIPRRLENFREYVKKFYDERLDAKAINDTIGDLLAKIFMNSLYGKFGANPENYKDYKVVPKGHREDGWQLSQILDSHDILERPTVAPQYFDVAAAASITGFARTKLMRAIYNSMRPIYCDTDSLLCEEFYGDELGDALGQWKHEGDFSNIWIAGKKCYLFQYSESYYIRILAKAKKGEIPKNYKIAHKGISALDAQAEDVKRAAAGEIVEIQKSAPNRKLDGSQVFFSRKIRKT